MREIVKAPPSAIVTSATAEEARAKLARARERLVKNLETVQRTLRPVTHWADFVKKHPLATIGGAFLVGFALSRLFSRK